MPSRPYGQFLYRNPSTGYTAAMEDITPSHRKIRVLYVVESFSTGVYAIVRDVACNLNPDLFSVHIIHSLRPDSPSNYSDDFAFPHISLQYVPMGSMKDYSRAIREIRSYIDNHIPDAIHLHSSKAGFLGRLAAHKFQGKIFYTPHGISFIRTDIGRLKRQIFFLLERWIQWYTPSRMIAVSDAELVNVKRLTEDAVAINNFIDVSRMPHGSMKESPLVGITGRITEAKNPNLFNRIASGLPNIKFMWIGDGPLRNELTASNIEVTGQLPRTEALKKLTQLSIYLQTSNWEGMPISLLEAMACKLPVIVSDIPAHRNLITNVKSGIICRCDDEHQFIEAIDRLIDSESEKQSLGVAAREHVLQYHDIAKAIQRYSEEYMGFSDTVD